MNNDIEAIKKSKIEALKEKKQKIEKRINIIEAKEKSKKRKEDTRRKILIGSYYLDKAKEEGSMQAIHAIMDQYLRRDTDRKLFDLKPIEQN